jgi:hypothetical protein
MMKRWIALAALAAANTATAHHSFGEFDMKRDVEIDGVVTGMDFVNPHSYLYLDIAQADGTVKPYRCEMRSATALRRSGWTPDLFPKGERLTILGSPAKDDSSSCYVGSIRFADGTTLDRYGQRSVTSVVSHTQRQTRLSNGVPNIAGDWAVEQLVMSDPRGQSGTLVPLSAARELAPGEVPEGQQPIPGARNSTQSTAAFQVRLPVERTAVGREAADSFNMFSSDNPRMRCDPTSILFDWAYDAAVNRVTQTEESITLEYGQYGLKRTIFVGGRGHPESIAPSRAGHSIGRWEGDLLMVDTVGFAPGVLVAPVLHGDGLHVVERFEFDPESVTLKRSYIAEDPEYFVGQYSGSDTLSLSNVPFAVEQCKELAKGLAPTDDVGGSDTPSSPAPTTIPPAKPWWKFWD